MCIRDTQTNFLQILYFATRLNLYHERKLEVPGFRVKFVPTLTSPSVDLILSSCTTSR